MRFRARHALSITALFLACGVVVAACGGAGSPGVASIGSSTTTTTSPAAGASSTNKATVYLDGVKYTECMRAHGVPNFPDPNGAGNFFSTMSRGIGTVNGVQVDENSSFYVKANKTCQHLLPVATPAQRDQFLARTLKYVQCLRTHGIPNMPDPTISDGNIRLSFGPTGLRPNSPRLQAAMRACQSFGPGG
jgi:hypothetical protein